MHDIRWDNLAKLLVEYSIRLKRNETVLIEAFDIPDEMTIALIRAAQKLRGIPFVQTQHTRINRALALEASDRQLNLLASHELARMKKMDATREDEIARQENAPRAGRASKKNEMGGFALADTVNGTTCRNEHGGV